jgi:hypothetical protein
VIGTNDGSIYVKPAKNHTIVAIRKPLCSTEKLGDGYPEHTLVENNYSF